MLNTDVRITQYGNAIWRNRDMKHLHLSQQGTNFMQLNGGKKPICDQEHQCRAAEWCIAAAQLQLK